MKKIAICIILVLCFCGNVYAELSNDPNCFDPIIGTWEFSYTKDNIECTREIEFRPDEIHTKDSGAVIMWTTEDDFIIVTVYQDYGEYGSVIIGRENSFQEHIFFFTVSGMNSTGRFVFLDHTHDINNQKSEMSGIKIDGTISPAPDTNVELDPNRPDIAIAKEIDTENLAKSISPEDSKPNNNNSGCFISSL